MRRKHQQMTGAIKSHSLEPYFQSSTDELHRL